MKQDKKLQTIANLDGNQIGDILLEANEYPKRYIELVWETVYNKLYPLVKYSASVFDGDYHKAEDVFQIAFTDLIVGKYKTHFKQGNFIAWCNKIIKMKMLEVRREKATRDNRFHISIEVNNSYYLKVVRNKKLMRI